MPNTHLELLHLVSEILSSLQSQFTKGLSEFEIICMLKKPPFSIFDENALHDSLVLFQTHFVVFHTLYKLRDEWREKQIGELNIGATLIKLEPLSLSKAGLQAHDPLADYYLDWQNFAATGQLEVDELLTSFWQKMAGHESSLKLNETDLMDAMTVLQLDNLTALSFSRLKQQYRKMQHRCHPDKGGSVEQSQLILQAYTKLHRHLSA